MMLHTSALLVALTLGSGGAESIEACNASTAIDGTCSAKLDLEEKALRLVGQLQQLEVLHAETEERRIAPCAASSEPYFTVMDGVQDQCPEGFEIVSAKECRDAIQALGLEAQMIYYMDDGINAPNVHEWNTPSWPAGCSLSQKSRLQYGVFNSDPAGKGAERVSLLCRTAAWEDALSSEWTGGHERLEGGEGCPADFEITSAAECEAAIGSLGLQVHDVIEAKDKFRPAGCSYFKDGRPGFPTRGLFNPLREGRADEEFDPICRKGATAAFEEVEIEDDLKAEEHDFAKFSSSAAGAVGRLSKS